jgi:hypothetical protein
MARKQEVADPEKSSLPNLVDDQAQQLGVDHKSP